MNSTRLESDAATSEQHGRDLANATRRGFVDPLRTVGFSLYLTWMLCTFYNTFLLFGATDIKATLYLNMLPSMATLTLTLFLLPRLTRNADKRVLSRAWTWGGGVLMASSTALLAFADDASTTGTVITLLSALTTGFSSGVLYLGWCRLYTDVGPRQALVEMSVASLAAAVLDVAFTYLPAPLSLVLVGTSALVSSLILRRSTFDRPRRPVPVREQRLRTRTKRMFLRGLAACAAVGLVTGFLDVLAGFRYILVPDYYEAMLAVGVAAMGLVMLAIGVFVHKQLVLTARRVVLAALILGSLLTVFIERFPGLPEFFVFGAYQAGFVVTLCVVCIDISNYFDQPATKVFGTSFGTLYLGESLGNALGHFLTLTLNVAPDTLATIALLLCAILTVVALFLFTESDLIETSIGEMTDDDEDDASSALIDANPFAQSEIAGPSDRQPELAPSEERLPSGTEPSRAVEARDIDQIAEELSKEYGLTPREGEVLPLILRGRTLARIQEELCISQGTAGTHTRHIYQKIGVHNRQALIDMLEERQHNSQT